MNDYEKDFAKVAEDILKAYNGSYKPHCFGVLNNATAIYMRYEGYMLVAEGDRGIHYCITKGPKKGLNDFLIHASTCMLNQTTIEQLQKSTAVQKLMDSITKETYGITVYRMLQHEG